MTKKLALSETDEEPPSDYWYHTSFRHGKVRRLKIRIKKKRHRQSSPITIVNSTNQDDYEK